MVKGNNMKDNFKRTMNFWTLGLSQWFWDTFIEKPETVTVRARNKKGHFVADDPKTKKNEAYKTVKKPKAKKKKSNLMHP